MAYLGQSTAAEKREEYEVIKPAKTGITALPENKNAKKPEAKRVPYVKYGLMAACVFAMLMCMLTSYSKVAQLTVEADKMRTQLAELKSDANALDAKKEQRFNLEYVEDVAVNQLGMVKQDKNQITYIAISNPEKITIAAGAGSDSSGIVAAIVKSFNAVVEYLN